MIVMNCSDSACVSLSPANHSVRLCPFQSRAIRAMAASAPPPALRSRYTAKSPRPVGGVDTSSRTTKSSGLCLSFTGRPVYHSLDLTRRGGKNPHAMVGVVRTAARVFLGLLPLSLVTACGESKPPTPPQRPRPKIEWKFTLKRTVGGDQLYNVASISPDGKWVAVDIGMGPLQVFDVNTGAVVFETSHRQSLERRHDHVQIAFSPSGMYMAALYPGVLVDLYTTADWARVSSNDDDPSWPAMNESADATPMSPVFSPDEKWLAWAQDGSEKKGRARDDLDIKAMVRIVRVPRVTENEAYLPEGYGTRIVAFSSDSSYLYTVGGGEPFETEPDFPFARYASREPGMRRWKTKLGQMDAVVRDENIGYGGFFDPSRDRAVTVRYDNAKKGAWMSRWDLKGMKVVSRVFVALEIGGGDWFPGSEWMFSIDDDKAYMINTETGEFQAVYDLSEVPLLDGRRRYQTEQFFSRDGGRAALACIGVGILVFDVERRVK